MTAPTNLTLALLLALVLATAHHLDGPTDHSAEWASAQALLAAQQQAQADARRDAAAAALCRHSHGEADHAWTPAGQLVCQPKRGRAVLARVQP
ncbi:MAG: hypothetical protein ACKVIH_01625 [Burkholderiales bacterium]